MIVPPQRIACHVLQSAQAVDTGNILRPDAGAEAVAVAACVAGGEKSAPNRLMTWLWLCNSWLSLLSGWEAAAEAGTVPNGLDEAAADLETTPKGLAVPAPEAAPKGL